MPAPGDKRRRAVPSAGPARLRRMALGMKDVEEGEHMGHPDFRVNGRVFASLHPDGKSGMVKLTPDEQEPFVRDYPSAFAPESGAWGRQGYTRVHLDEAADEALGEALTLAWQTTARPPSPRRRKKPPAPRA